MDKSLPVGARHQGIDLGNDDFSHINCRPGYVDRGAQAAIAVGIGNGYMDQRHIYRKDVFAEKLRYLAEEHGYVIAVITVGDGAGIGGNKKRFEEKAAGIFWFVE